MLTTKNIMKNTNRVLITFIHLAVILSLSGCSRSVDADPQKMESDSISTANRDITVKESSYPEKNMTIKKTYRGSDVIMQETDIDGVKTISYSINGKCVCIEADEDKDGSFECISIFDPDTDEFEIFYREKDGSVHPMEPKELQEMRQKTQEAAQAWGDTIQNIQKEIDESTNRNH